MSGCPGLNPKKLKCPDVLIRPLIAEVVLVAIICGMVNFMHIVVQNLDFWVRDFFV